MNYDELKEFLLTCTTNISNDGLAILGQAISDKHWDIRYYAVDAFISVGAQGYPLLKDLVSSSDWNTRMNVARALGEAGDLLCAPILAPMLCDENATVRYYTVKAMGWLKADAYVKDLICMMQQDSEGYVRWRAAWALGKICDKEAAESLRRAALGDSYWRVRLNAFEALKTIDTQLFHDVAMQLTTDINALVASVAQQAT